MQLYRNLGKVAQDIYLTQLLYPRTPDRCRNRAMIRKKEFSCHYYLICGESLLAVCRKFFLEALSLTTRRIYGVGKIKLRGDIPRENRGGYRRQPRKDKDLQTLEKKEQFYYMP